MHPPSSYVKRFLYIILCIFFGAATAPCAAESFPARIQKIHIVKDTWVSAVHNEQYGNNGAAGRLKLKGQQEFALVDFDPLALKGAVIEKAVLHVRSSTPVNAPMMRLGASTMASPWAEGHGTRYRREAGSACFSQAVYKKSDWAYPGSTVLDAVFGKGHTLWRFSDCTPPDPDGWQACAVQPEVLAARVAGISHGICLFDEVGSEWSLKNGQFRYHNYPNRFLYSRESRSGPWLEVRVAEIDRKPPEPIDHIDVQTKGLPGGEALCLWDTPRDHGGGKTLGFHVAYEKNGKAYPVPRYLIPMAREPGQPVRMHLQDLDLAPGERIILHIQPVDSAGNVGAVTSESFSVAGGVPFSSVDERYTEAPFGTNTISGPSGRFIAVLDLLDKVDPATGNLIPSGRSASAGECFLFDAEKKKIVLHAARNETVWFQLNLNKSAEKVTIEGNFKQHSQLKWKVFKFAHVSYTESGKKRWVPDPLIPLGLSINQFGRDGSASADFGNQSFLCELYVPHQTSPGIKTGSVLIHADDEVIALEVELKVWNFTLPDKLSFIPEMNAYGRVSPFKGYDYYMLAHEHRTCLNRLPYGWNGKPEFAPVWSGSDFDWKQWDHHVGPLLDGSAFKGLKRDSEPVDVMYLPFNENWPIEIYANYSPSYWVEEALTVDYRTALGSAFSAFAEHVRDKGWNGTIFEFYLNNKVYNRQKAQQNSAPWVFDEPVNTQDFWALRWYGQLWQEAVAPFRSDATLWFRADISYSQYARNLLWGIMDVEYTGGNTPQKVRMKQDEWRLWEPSHYFEYGSANKLEQANTQPVLWCLSAWSNGAIGVMPWQTIGNEKSWETADQNALFYPQESGPVPSVRLKAFTYGQQLVEYLTLFMKEYDVPRQVVADWLKALLQIDGQVVKQSAQDAGTIMFDGVTPVDLQLLRRQLGEMISAKSPPYRRSWVDFTERIPVKRRAPNLGYVHPAPDVESMKPDCDRF